MKFKSISLFIMAILLTACGADQENEHLDNIEVEEKDPAQSEQPELPSTPLQKWDSGDDILQLKVNLQAIGYTINEEPTFDETTTWAITDFQLQTTGLRATGVYDDVTKDALEKVRKDNETIEAGIGLAPLTEEVFTAAGSQVLGNPYDLLALVNKENALPADYVPNDLVVPNVRFPFEEDLPKKQLRFDAASALEELFRGAEQAGLYLFAQSGYRSYERQADLFSNYTAEHGEEAAHVFSARAGESEHQTGLTMDITSENVGYQLTTDFGETPEGQWLKENAHEYGFIIRYPEGKEDITQYQFEPWHLRYVGVKVAQEIFSENLTFEEYYETINK